MLDQPERPDAEGARDGVAPDRAVSGAASEARGAGAATLRDLALANPDWARTGLGPSHAWSPSLRTAASLVLASHVPMGLFWGPDLCAVYNDACSRSIGGASTGTGVERSGDEVWGAAWSKVRPLLARVMGRNETVWLRDVAFDCMAQGQLRETYLTWCYSPIAGECGAVGGVLACGSDTTDRVLAERRRRMLRALGVAVAGVQPAPVDVPISGALGESPADLPFALVYAVTKERARLVSACGVERGHRLAAEELTLSDSVWPLARAMETRSPELVDDLGRHGDLPSGPWCQPPRRALVLPIGSADIRRPRGLLVAGISARLELDAAYREYLAQVATALIPAVAIWRAHEARVRVRAHTRSAGTAASASTEAASAELGPAEAALRRSRGLLRRATEVGRVGLWDWDIVHDRITWTDSLTAIHGVDRDALDGTADSFRALVHPEDLPRVDEAISRAIAQDVPFEEELRSIRPDGEVVWLLATGRVLRRRGRPMRMQGATVEITSRKRAELALRESEERFRVALEMAGVGFSILTAVRDASGTIMDFTWAYVNPRAVAEIGSPIEQILGERVSELLPGIWDEKPTLFQMFVDVIETGAPGDVEVRDVSAVGERWFRNLGAKLGDGVACWFADDTARRQNEEKLREADRRKDEFLATLAHELRNPLAPIRNAVALMRLDVGVPGVAWARDVIDRQSQQMTRLIDDLLEVSRITTGRLRLDREPVELCGIIHGALETSAPLMQRSGHTLVTHLPGEPLFLCADATRLAQVFSNLLNNAARYTKPGGTIELRVERRDRDAIVTVRDNGIGIAREMLEEVFELFAQADRSLERTNGGLGIGLTLAKRLVDMHGGRIDAKSDGLGKGSVFTVSLPLLEGADERHVDASKPAPMRAARGLRVLLADDNVDAAESLGLFLRLEGHEVEVVHDGLAAARAARDPVFDAAVLDIGMPGRSGYDIARDVRSEHGSRRTLLIALTGWGQEEDRRRSAEAGFDHHLVKPIDPADLVAILRALQEADAPTAR